MTQNWQSAGFALYVHWPFCQSKCPYCDFNSHVASQIDQTRWRNAYLSELRRVAAETEGRVLRSIFFGGGTPSLMPPETVEAIISLATDLWSPANDIEITLEANPTSVEAGRFLGFRSAGVNRVSIGVQALNDADLRRLGRLHDTTEARNAIVTAQATFSRSSFDLIYARQEQTFSAWQAELALALSLAADHLSLYQLTIEPGTVFGARHDLGQLRGLPEEDLAADMYLLTQDMCEAAGRPAYEVSNHAIPGQESRHNTVYWRSGDYVGIGPGAHGRITTTDGQRFATVCPKAPGAWLTAVEASQFGEEPRQTLSLEDQAEEFLIMGLRLVDGIDIDAYARLSGRKPKIAARQQMHELGLITETDNRLAATRSGRLVLNSIIAALAE